MSLKRNLCFLFGCMVVASLSTSVAAQSQDSLWMVWEDPNQSDSLRVQAFKEYIWNGYLFSNPDSAILLSEEMIAFSVDRAYPIAENQANTLMSIAYDIQGDFTKGMEYVQKALVGNERIGNKQGISECEIVIGVLYDEQGNYPRALEHYNRALAIDEEIGNKEGMAMSLNNIGNLYNTQGNGEKALENYLRALAIDQELGVKQGIATELVNISQIYLAKGDTTLALKNLLDALEVNEEIGDLDGVASTLASIGAVYAAQGDPSRAMEYYEDVLELRENLGHKSGIARIEGSIGAQYIRQGQAKRALDHCKRSFDISEEIGALEVKVTACKCLYRAHKVLGNTAEALRHYEEMIEARDLVYNEENTKKLTQLNMQYEFDKKEAATRAEQEKKDAIARQKLQRQKLVRNGFMFGFAVVLLFAGVFFRQRNRIGKEKERSEELLLNILPEETAQELKEKGHSDAQLIDQVTVLFTDFKGFTALSEQVTPQALVADLHECFSAFDQICEKYNIEKIKTIGDAYMAAGGLPTPNDTHAKDVVRAALEMTAVVKEGKARKIAKGLPFFEVRVGLHTGPVVAGIVGVKKFQYDIWGDTVNTAARMESSGEVGKVNLSQSTYELLKNESDLEFESRGMIKAKGKGEVEMWFVRSKS